jgi:hypothetical protein
VVRRVTRERIGKTLLIAATSKFLEILETPDGFGLPVDAKGYEAKRYYQPFGFVPLHSNELELFLPVETIQGAFPQGGK